VSILKRFLNEDLGPLVRRPGASYSAASPVPSTPLAVDPRQYAPASAPGKRTGMQVVILNWSGGENDPFSVMNETLRQHFRACGKNVAVVELARDDWWPRLLELAPLGVELAFTWQGLGSGVTMTEKGESIWEHLRIPLVCVHGDHPSHMPGNHQLESRYCFHLYTNAEFARYSNRHFRRLRGASVIDIPQLHRERPLSGKAGDHFVIAKNLDDPVETEQRWRETLDKRTYDAYMAAAESVKGLLAKQPYVELHEVIDDIVERDGIDWLSASGSSGAHHAYHSELDFYVHSHKTAWVVTQLRDVPLRICGRGWDRLARSASRVHVFEAGRPMAQSQPLYYSRYGIIDISPAKGLHDRTRRAMVNGTGFLSSANLEDSFADIARYGQLFYDFTGEDLRAKCAAVMQAPEEHATVARSFADRYHDRFHFRQFVNRIDDLANGARWP
jgi:hypothetical protein